MGGWAVGRYFAVDAGYAVLTAETGAGALAMLGTPGLPVVCASGEGSVRAMRRGMPAGDGFPLAPFPGEDLERALGEVFAAQGSLLRERCLRRADPFFPTFQSARWPRGWSALCGVGITHVCTHADRDRVVCAL